MQRLLVALDGSPRAEGVLRIAALLAQKYEAELILFRAVPHPTGVPVEALTESPERFAEDLRAHARDELQVLLAKVGVTATLQVVIGQPWHAICESAKGYDLIVIGSHGYGGLDRVLGTTAAKVVDHASCSVFVVKTGDGNGGAHEPRANTIS